MSTNTDSLKTAWQTIINTITTDDVQKYEALEALDQYIAAYAAQASSASNDVTSYSINGRSVTRSGGSSMQSNVQKLKANLVRIVYGNSTLVDFRLPKEFE